MPFWDSITNVKSSLAMRIEDPFWNTKFMENLPKWIHIWVTTVGLGCGILFIVNSMVNLVDGTGTVPRLLGLMGLICLVVMILNRDTFLPFLAENFLPENFLALKERQPADLKAVKMLNVPVAAAGRKVLYWAAEPPTAATPAAVRPTWQEGYGKFANSGVVTSDAQGMAHIPLVCPGQYMVHGYKVLPKHLHYRVYNEQTQMLSRVFTIVLTTDCPAA